MQRFLIVTSVAAALALAAGSPAFAAAKKAEPAAEYDRDLISIVTLGRHSDFPTANCYVWVNAEGLGVGPAQLDGFHGVSMNINLHPMANESAKAPTSFAMGLAELKAKYPTTPAWMIKTVEKNQAGIEAACAQDHPTPFKVYGITARDKQG
jgi:hypothetical protein